MLSDCVKWSDEGSILAIHGDYLVAGHRGRAANTIQTDLTHWNEFWGAGHSDEIEVDRVFPDSEFATTSPTDLRREDFAIPWDSLPTVVPPEKRNVGVWLPAQQNPLSNDGKLGPT